MLAAPYKRILASRAARLPIVATAIDRLPVAAMSLSVILLVRGETGSFAVAGLVEATFAIALAVSLPMQGRLVDRLRQTRVLSVALLLNPIALIALVLAARAGVGAVPLAVIGVACGATVPATGSCMRTLWPSLFPDTNLRQAAYAIDAVLIEVAFVVGPLVTATLVAVGSPTVAVLANAVFTAVGTLLFVISRASRSWRGQPQSGHWAGPLRSRGILGLLSVELTFGIALGAMEISITAFATQHGSASLAGVLIAVQAAASMAGGLWYGSRRHSGHAADRYARLCLFLALGFCTLLLATSPLEALPLMALSGFSLAPAGTVLFGLVEDLAPRGTVTEAFTWMITSVAGGAALGSAIGGVLVTGGHPHRGLAATALAALLSCAAAYLVRPHLRLAARTA